MEALPMASDATVDELVRSVQAAKRRADAIEVIRRAQGGIYDPILKRFIPADNHCRQLAEEAKR